MLSSHWRIVAPAMGAILGAAFCLWIVSARIVTPTEIAWTMKLDWRFQFLSWHIFRDEPWRWPPGRVDRFYSAPNGTSIGYTDSVPLVALALKPFSWSLPKPLQYIGAWWMLCFAFQGLFGVLLMRLWTPSIAVQLLGALMFILTPALLARVVHPGLCSHWLILWSVWLYFTRDGDRRLLAVHILAIAALSGLIHPYLVVMVLGLLGAVVIRARAGGIALAIGALIAITEWWLSGLFLLSTADMARQGLSDFSMNLLSVITPSGWSRLLPEMPVYPPLVVGQSFEGMQYQGAGGLLLWSVGAALTVFFGRTLPWSRMLPLMVVVLGFAVYSLSPRVTLGSRVLVDLTSAVLDQAALFRVTGRFFWPVAYVTLLGSMVLIVTRLPARAAVALLAAAVALQFLDLSTVHAQRRALARSPEFHVWKEELRSPVWASALPHYDHFVLYLPAHCGAAPITFEAPAYLAGFYGLSINAGESARWSESERIAYCADLDRALSTGKVDDRSLYLVHRGYEQRLRQHAPQLVCGEVEGLRVCVTAASYQQWRHAARLD